MNGVTVCELLAVTESVLLVDYINVFLLTIGGLENRFVFSELSFTIVFPCWERVIRLYIRAVNFPIPVWNRFFLAKLY